MQLPKTPRGQKFKEKKCMYPGCEKVFHGIHISKYCVEHRKDRYRIRKRAKPEDVNLKNQTIQHKYTTVVEQTMTCALEQCENQFTIKVFPRQYIYPKFCPDHRNEYRRERHLRLIGREDLIETMKGDNGMIIIPQNDNINFIDDETKEDTKPENNDNSDADDISDLEDSTPQTSEDFQPTEEFDESELKSQREDYLA
ncbi:MAG: hypothetical protein LBH98_03320 [Chitinispirillales bacterium]|jgi:hypothetical protein|nr:hypothetical protein [Chitinispirillales bacterium]